MAQITEDFANRMIEIASRGEHPSLTCWEAAQLAWAWLKLNHCATIRAEAAITAWGPAHSAGAEQA